MQCTLCADWTLRAGWRLASATACVVLLQVIVGIVWTKQHLACWVDSRNWSYVRHADVASLNYKKHQTAPMCLLIFSPRPAVVPSASSRRSKVAHATKVHPPQSAVTPVWSTRCLFFFFPFFPCLVTSHKAHIATHSTVCIQAVVCLVCMLNPYSLSNKMRSKRTQTLRLSQGSSRRGSRHVHDICVLRQAH